MARAPTGGGKAVVSDGKPAKSAKSDRKTAKSALPDGRLAKSTASDGKQVKYSGKSAKVDRQSEDIKPVLSAAVQPSASNVSEPQFLGMPLKWVSLVVLTVQTSGQVLLIKWARLDAEAQYLNSTVVVFQELVKIVASLALVAHSNGLDIGATVDEMHRHFCRDKREVMKAAVPALIYTIQNNLMFYSLDKLSGPIQQVLYQMRTLTTACFGVLLLGKSLSWAQWTSVFLLMAGVSLVQWPQTDEQQSVAQLLGSEHLKGFFAVLCACTLSGFAGIYIQRMMQQTEASIWMRNVQFGTFGAFASVIVAYAQDGHAISERGFVQGYTERVVYVVFMMAFGGLARAFCLKYAGATLACFSTAASIMLTVGLQVVILEGFTLDRFFMIGTFAVIVSCFLYELGWPVVKK